jgi:hypothetical protein
MVLRNVCILYLLPYREMENKGCGKKYKIKDKRKREYCP